MAAFALCETQACPQVTAKTLDTAPLMPRANVLPATTAQVERTPVAPSGGLPSAEQEGGRTPAPGLPARSSPAEAPHPARDAGAGMLSMTVTFGFAQFQLSAQARAALDAAARRAAGAHALHIVGRTDNVGDRPANDALALARARAVRDHLRSRLDPWPATVDVEAAGTCCYAADNATAAGRLANRRVEVTFSMGGPGDVP